jgi:hypothetical protein
MQQVSGLCGLIEGSLVLLDVRDHVLRPPFLHPVLDSLGYAPLARHLGDPQSTYKLQSPGPGIRCVAPI